MGVLADLFRVPIDYLLEYQVDIPGIGPHAISSITMPSPPTGISYQRDGAVAVEFTMGNRPIRDFGEMRTGRLTIQGLSGTYNRSTYTQFGTAGGIVFKDGQQSVTNFEKFLERYHADGAGTSIATALLGETQPLLVFRAIKENIHVFVEVLSFQQSKQTRGTRHFPAWRLDLKIWGTTGTGDGFSNILSPVSDMFEQAAATVDIANNYIAAADNALVNLRGDLESLRAPMKAVLRTTEALSNVVDSAKAVARFPDDLVSDFVVAAQQLELVWGNTKELLGILPGVTGGNLADDWERIKKTVGWPAENAALDSLTLAGLNGTNAGHIEQAEFRLSLADYTWSTTQRPTRAPRRRRLDNRTMQAVRLQAGEDLRDLAFRFYQDRERWQEIAEYNNWLSAHVDGDGVASAAGALVLVPLEQRIDVSTSGPSDEYQTDLKIDLSAGDLVVDAAGTGFLKVSGPDNLVQGLSMRFLTEQGDSDPFPAFGLPPMVGQKNSQSMLGLIGAHAREQALRDARIKDVLDIELLASGSTASVSITAVADGHSPPVTLIAPLRTG